MGGDRATPPQINSVLRRPSRRTLLRILSRRDQNGPCCRRCPCPSRPPDRRQQQTSAPFLLAARLREPDRRGAPSLLGPSSPLPLPSVRFRR
uniref:Uncharacterized protein n=1 Tax=Arundo donax TaxID=35708 RepID=A0A0A9CZA8_ARUDO